MHELVETVLTVRTRLSANDRACVHTLCEALSLKRHCLALGLHVELLNVSGEPQQGLTVRQQRSRIVATNVRVIKADKSEQGRHILRLLS